MPLLDTIQDGIARFMPKKSSSTPAMSGGIGSGGHVMVPFDDEMIVSKPAIIFHTGQIFFNFLAMACFASVASFQAHWGVGPSGLSGFAIFVSVAGIILSSFMLLVPVIYEKYDKFIRLARALKELRVAFILGGAGTGVSLLIAFIVTISAWTQPGCKNPDNDPNQDKGDDFKKGLDGWCSTKKAAAVFFWLAFGFWLATFVLLIMDWRSGKVHHAPARDPPFNPPAGHDDGYEEGEDEESSYGHIPPVAHRNTTYDDANAPFSDENRFRDSDAPTSAGMPGGYGGGGIPAGRPSMDAYGAFSDPAPSGFGNAPPTPPAPASPSAAPAVSRTMQYADPYAVIRANVGAPAGAAPPTSTPPSYESYPGYR